MSDREEIENISTSEKEQSVSSPFIHSYIRSYSETRIKSNILDHTWKIDRFVHFSEIIDTIKSPSFPETGQYVIQMNVLRQAGSENVMNFYIRTSKPFNGSCNITILYPPGKYFSGNYIFGRISDMTLLVGISSSKFPIKIDDTDTLMIHCKFEIVYSLKHETSCKDSIPSLTGFSKDVSCLGNLIFDEFWCEDKESVKFVIGREHYYVSKKMLRESESSYFEDICFTHKGRKKDMTNELVTNNEIQAFKQVLLYIVTGSIELCDYDMLKELIKTADKYDLPSLKFMCECYLLRYITIENAMELVQFTSSCDAKFLKKLSENFIKFHVKDIVGTTQFETRL